ncbi:glycosyltransferase family 39 protein [Marinoscillum luteum]|uniref:Glycosyltransferase family 39 protein n=1 Tax=Marinoscillum luteum TaxID=861051 RepID=A0ABW7N5X1_9BACT
MISPQASGAFKAFTESKASSLLLILLWLLAQLIAYLLFGIQTPVDTKEYMTDALSIRSGEWPSDHTFWYSGYSSLLALIHWFGAPYEAIIWIQLIASALAAAALYHLAQLWGGESSAFIATLLYIGWLEIHQWTMILYTDSLFTSLIILSVYAIYFSHHRLQYLGAFVLILLTAFIRPVGALFLAALLSALFFHPRVKTTPVPYRIGIGLIVLVGFLFLLNFILQDYVSSFINSYSQAEIIYPGRTILTPPKSLEIPDTDLQPLVRLVSFMVYNPLYFLQLSLMKGLLYLGHVKPYFSIIHNLIIVLSLYPIYYFSIRGWKSVEMNPLKAFITIFISSQVLMVSFTSENWDGRFLLPVLPWIFLLASIGLSRSFFESE